MDIFKIFKLLLIIGLVGVLTFMTAACVCTFMNDTPASNNAAPLYEEPIIKYEKVPATVISVDKNQWFAGCAHRRVTIKVHNDTYNIDKTIEETYNGMMVGPLWDLRKGDTVTVKVCYRVSRSAGERISTPYVSHIVT